MDTRAPAGAIGYPPDPIGLLRWVAHTQRVKHWSRCQIVPGSRATSTPGGKQLTKLAVCGVAARHIRDGCPSPAAKRLRPGRPKLSSYARRRPSPRRRPRRSQAAKTADQDRIVGTPVTVNMTGVGTAADPGVFDPVNFTFSVGEAVNFTLFAEDAFHSFTVSELEINVEVNARRVRRLGLRIRGSRHIRAYLRGRMRRSAWSALSPYSKGGA